MTLKTFTTIYHCLHRDYQIDVTNCVYLLKDSTTKKMLTFRNYLWNCDVGEVIKL